MRTNNVNISFDQKCFALNDLPILSSLGQSNRGTKDENNCFGAETNENVHHMQLTILCAFNVKGGGSMEEENRKQTFGLLNRI